MKGVIIGGLLIAALFMVFATAWFGILGAVAVGLIPFAIVFVLAVILNPYWGLIAIFIANYFVMGVIRYFPSLPGGVVMDLLMLLTTVGIILQSCFHRIEWGQIKSPLTLLLLLWLIYCMLEFFNPQVSSFTAWAASVRGVAVYGLVIVIMTFLLFWRFRDLKRILTIWSVLTLLAVLKAYIQKNYGFDAAEMRWLFVDGGSTTHVIYSGIRYFSFFSDAANFGSGMGFSMVVFSLVGLRVPGWKMRLYFFAVAFAAAYGMMISGTRGALAVPFAGYTLYLLLSKNLKILILGLIFVGGAYLFLNHTMYGQGNAYIRRMRSAFNADDPSFVVRLENQRKMREYMRDKPFGVGLGLGGGKAKQYAPEAYMSQIPTDSWFVMIWVETGIVGLALHLLTLLFILGWGCFIVLFRIRDPELRGTLGALVAGFFGVMVTSYGNEILGQFPTGFIIYMTEAFIFMGLRYDKELAGRKLLEEKQHEQHT